jgi:ribosomal-protein-alanine N-acetyltransferase
MQQPIVTQRLILRPPERRILYFFMDYIKRNKDFLQPWEPLHSETYYKESFWKKWLTMYKKRVEAGTELRYWLFLKEDDMCIGYLSCSGIIRGVFHSGHLGYACDEKYGGQGYMSEALEKFVSFMFEHENLHRVEANINPINKASIRVAEKNGFTLEGKSPEYLYINGKWEDHLRYAKLNKGFSWSAE